MQTSLYAQHVKLNAKIIPFAGWDMPLYYTGIFQEVAAVRNQVGLFDVSHMGRITITGSNALQFLDYLSTNTVLDKPLGKAFYTIFCNKEGYPLDDLLVYLIDSNQLFIVVNASNREKIFQHLNVEGAKFKVEIKPHFDEGILSLQGPKSPALIKDYPPLSPFQILFHHDMIISRTGYTGEEGYEFYGKSSQIKALWDLLIREAQPCGLGARDVLRLEKGYALYGHELNKSIYPTESVAKRFVKMHHQFLGKEALEKVPVLRYPVFLSGLEKIPAREGYLIFYKRENIGFVTSGTFSPTFKQPIALGLINEPLNDNSEVEVLIRSNYYPFLTRRI